MAVFKSAEAKFAAGKIENKTAVKKEPPICIGGPVFQCGELFKVVANAYAGHARFAHASKFNAYVGVVIEAGNKRCVLLAR